MKFWDWIQNFHESFVKDEEVLKSGISSVKYLRGLFEPYWVERDSDKHPFYSMLSIASDSEYERLRSLVDKLKELSRIPNHEILIRRMADYREYYSVLHEIDTLLRFKQANIEISIICPTQEMRTPDFILRLEKTRIWIETTSINPPSNAALYDLIGQLMTISMSQHVAITGHFTRKPEQKETEEILKRVERAVIELKGTEGVSKINIPGLMILFARTGPLTDGIPERYRDGISIHEKDRVPKVERIVKKIEEKCKENYQIADSGFLIIYDESGNDQDLFNMMTQKERNLTDVVSSYPNLLGLAVMMPNARNSPSVCSKEYDDINNQDEACFSISGLPGQERCGILAWRNICADKPILRSIISAIFHYGVDQEKLEEQLHGISSIIFSSKIGQ